MNGNSTFRVQGGRGGDQAVAHVKLHTLGGVFAGHHTEVGADAGATEPVPVANLNRQRERGQGRDATQTRQPVHPRGELVVVGERGDLLIGAVTAGLWP